jgi:cell division protein FtsQ
MRTLSLRRSAPEPRRDPAPTVWSYRYQRLMLTPLWRMAFRIGLPAALVAAIAGAWFSSDANRAWVGTRIADLRAAIEERPEFMVTGMEVTGANAAVRMAIEDLVTIAFPTSSWRLDLDAIRLQVTELTAVKDVTVRVRPGGTLEIAVTERIPVAVWRYTDGLRLIDAEGVMTGMIAERADRADLPLIAGDGAKDVIDEALALFAAAEPIGSRVRGLVRMGERRWDMVLDRDQRILLPETDAVAALHRVVALDQAQDMLARDVALVDMRLGQRPTLRLHTPALNVIRNTEYVEPLPEE